MPICFDLDGTLGHFSGGYVLLCQALGEIWGMEPEAGAVRACRGSTDWEIVDELHQSYFGQPLEEAHYLAFQSACLAKFEAAFPSTPGRHCAYQGILSGLGHLRGKGLPVAVVSGNAPAVLDFKLWRLGLGPDLPRFGSLPRHDRAMLLKRAREGCQGPHLYLGDRPHDLEAASQAGMPFLGVGELVPLASHRLPVEASAERLVGAVETLLAGSRP